MTVNLQFGIKSSFTQEWKNMFKILISITLLWPLSWSHAEAKTKSKMETASLISQQGGLAFKRYAKNFINHTISDQWIKVRKDCTIEYGYKETHDGSIDGQGLVPVFTHRTEGSLAVLRPELTNHFKKAPIIQLMQRGGGGDSVRTVVDSRYGQRIHTGIAIELFVDDRHATPLLEWLTHMSNLCSAPDYK